MALIHSIEFVYLFTRLQAHRIWSWTDIGSELFGANTFLNKIFSCLLGDRSFIFLNYIRLIIAVLVVLNPSWTTVSLLLVLHVLTVLRWLGTYNGGSDYMHLLTLWLVLIGLIYENATQIVLWAIALQTSYSYFKAGWVKVIKPNWRNGSVIQDFLNSPTYSSSSISLFVGKSHGMKFCLAWSVLCFELLFPMAIFCPETTNVFLILGGLFHMSNVYFFGLNRFFWTWLNTYPAVAFVATRI